MEEVKVYKKALELACKCFSEDDDYWLDKAKEALLEEGNLTENQRNVLANKINAIEKAVECKFTHLLYDCSRSDCKYVALQTRSAMTGLYTTKVIIYGTLVSFADDVFASGKPYEIKKLLGEEE